MSGGAGEKDLSSNSLLESTPAFELASRAKPIINQEHTSTIDNIIKLRVLGDDWDDVIPRALTDVGSVMREDEAPEISQEKSKLGLGKLYKQEYLKKCHEIRRRGRGEVELGG